MWCAVLCCRYGFTDCWGMRFGTMNGYAGYLDCAHPELWQTAASAPKSCFRFAVWSARNLLAGLASTAAFFTLVMGASTSLFARLLQYSDHPRRNAAIWMGIGLLAAVVGTVLPWLNVLHTPLSQTVVLGSCVSVYGVARLYRLHTTAVLRNEKPSLHRPPQTPNANGSGGGGHPLTSPVDEQHALIVAPIRRSLLPDNSQMDLKHSG